MNSFLQYSQIFTIRILLLIVFGEFVGFACFHCIKSYLCVSYRIKHLPSSMERSITFRSNGHYSTKKMASKGNEEKQPIGFFEYAEAA
jgi:hypothetical protein